MVLEKDKLNNVLKIDLDIKTKSKAINHLSERIRRLNYLGVLPYDLIDIVYLIKKTSYSCKILLKKKLSNENILHIQSILELDWRRTAICFRDLIGENNPHWNKMFDIKKYSDGSYKQAKYLDVTTQVLQIDLYKTKSKQK